MATDLERLVIALTERQNNFIAQLQTQQSEALAAMMTRVESRPPEARSLVDSRGIGKPDTLTSKTAHNQTEFKVWRVKYVNWVTASMPEMLDLFAQLERNNEDIITDEKYREFLQVTPAVANFSAQLRATLVSLCVAEPLNVVLNTPVSPQAGLESMRRLNQRYDPVGPLSSKLILQKLMSTKPVGSTDLRSSLVTSNALRVRYLMKTTVLATKYEPDKDEHLSEMRSNKPAQIRHTTTTYQNKPNARTVWCTKYYNKTELFWHSGTK